MIKFSVIVANYNHGRFLKERLDSIFAQHYGHYEVIIIDDASSDNSRDIIRLYEAYQKITRIILHKENSGSAFLNWQEGMKIASGDYIWIAESDDVAAPTFLSTMNELLTQRSEVSIAYCDAAIIDETGQQSAPNFATRKNKLFTTDRWSNDYCNDGNNEITDWLQYDCTVNNVSSMVFNKVEAMKHLEALRQYRYFGDWFFVLSMCIDGSICYTAQTLNSYRSHQQSHLQGSNDAAQEKKEYFNILRWLLRSTLSLDKKRLMDHFAHHYLGVSFRKTNLMRYVIDGGSMAVPLLWRAVMIRIGGRRFVKTAFAAENID